MSDAAPQRWFANAPVEPPAERHDRIFRSLPALESPEYLALLKTASATDLPAEVLVRAYRALGCAGPAAEATLGRLLTKNEQYGYLQPLVRLAERRVRARDWFSAADLAGNAVGTIALALAGPQGKGADRAWVTFLRQRLEDAYRELNGRRDERRDPERAEPHADAVTGAVTDPMESDAVLHTAWHGRVDPNHVEWLESFARRTMACIAHREMREIGLDQISAERSTISGPGTPGRPSLATKYRVSRFQIMRWRDAALARLLVALETQNDVDIDVGWLREALAAKDRTRHKG